MDLERPQTLELPLTPRTPLRSSLRKNSASYNRYHMGGGSSGGTPTNPTPPDSLSEEVSGSGVTSGVPTMGASRSDSGFVSTSNRVRFSPSPYEKGGGVYVTDWSPTHEPPRATPKSPFPAMQNQRGRSSTPSSTHHYITESDLQRDFNLYPQTWIFVNYVLNYLLSVLSPIFLSLGIIFECSVTLQKRVAIMKNYRNIPICIHSSFTNIFKKNALLLTCVPRIIHPILSRFKT